MSLFYVLFALLCRMVYCQQQQDPSTLNGGSAMAMAGDACVALAIDQRFGSGPQMVNVSPRKILTFHSKLMLAFTGLESDVQSIAEELTVCVHQQAKMNGIGVMFSHYGQDSNSSLRKQPQDLISPRAMASLTSNVLYSKRASPFYCEPIIAGLELVSVNKVDSNDIDTRQGGSTQKSCYYKPFLCSQDILGAQLRARDFVCTGAAKNSLYGTAEALWRPGLGPEELGRVCARAFMSALERDCLSGYGARIYIITKDGIVEQEILSRSD